MKIFSVVCVVILVALPAPPHVRAQEIIVRDVTGSGGTMATGSGFQLAHTIGQPVIGISTGTDRIQEAGFWYMPWFFVTGVEERDDSPPADYRLYQNYPNPFNPVTTIRFALPGASWVSLKIYDVLGREVMTVIDEETEVGIHTRVLNAAGLSSGIYFYRIRAAGFVRTRKMVILR
jgi:hypothetical protein